MLLALTDPDLVSTAIKVEDSGVVSRLYSVGREPLPLKATTQGLKVKESCSLSGENITHLNPFQIGELVMSPDP